MKKRYIFLIIFLALVAICFLISYRPSPEKIIYGVSFSEFRSEALGLSPKETFDAIVDDLGVRYFRLSSHWPIIEPERDVYDFDFLDYQIKRLEKVNGKAILTLGRRQPAWPECHTPYWVGYMPKAEKEKEILDLIEKVVKRYKDSVAIEYWQVENEPFLSQFATEQCGELDEDFLAREISLVKEIDPSRKVIVTDSGNIGMWYSAYKAGDAFGTSLYRFFYTPDVGIFNSYLPPAFYRAKYNINRLLLGKKPAFLIELAGEPWLVKPIIETPIETQLSRMSIDMYKDSIVFAKKTKFERQYLWGAEWWYWLKENNLPTHWEYSKTLFDN